MKLTNPPEAEQTTPDRDLADVIEDHISSMRGLAADEVCVGTDVQNLVNEIKALTALLVCAAHGRLEIEKDESAPDAPTSTILEWYGHGVIAVADLIDRKCEAIADVVPD